MPRRVRRLALTALFLCLTALAAADPGAALRDALRDVPASRLLDRAVILTDLTAHDGRQPARPLTAADLRQMVHELHGMAAAPAPWPTAADLRAAARQGREDGTVPLAVIDLAYDRLRPDALRDGRLVPRKGRLVPAPGVTADRLVTREHLFAAAPLVERTCRGAAVTFTLPRDLIVSDVFGGRLELDPGDGGGWRTLAPGGAVVAHYRQAGTHELRVRATRSDGSVRVAGSVLEVVALVVPPPTETWPITASIPFEGAAGTGTAYVYLAEDHAALTDPVVVIEGFDIDDSLGWEELYTLLNQENLLEDLRAGGRDAVVLDFTASTTYIQRNAFVVTELLQQVEAAIAPDLEYALVGASMGGLVGRYALTWLEDAGQPARVRTFVSFDGAQEGANIPLGLQYWLAFFQDESADAAYLLSRLDTPAARQMLLYHHTDPPGPTGTSDPLRADLRADLASLGDWPALPRLATVANGSGTGADQGFGPAAQIIRWEYSSLLVDITGNVWAVPDQSSHVIFDGLIDLIWPLPDSEQTVTVQGTWPLDGGPGGLRASMAQMDAVDVPYGDLQALHPAHAFIPTISAIALDTDDPFFDIAGQPDLPSLTPFDAVYVPAGDNQEHVLVTPENKAWLVAEIEGTVTAVPGAGASPPAAPVVLGSHPNPFNPRTTVAFAVPQTGPARLVVLDARGRRVRTLVDGRLSAGRHAAAWDGRDDAGRTVAAGVYLVRIEQAGRAAARSVTLVK